MEDLIDVWQRLGSYVEIGGRRVFYVDAGPRGAPVLLVLHGFPTSSLDFHRVLEILTTRHRVVLHDHLGFGLSDKPVHYSYSLLEQAETALVLWRELGIERGHLLAHDYGTSVATEVVARRERGGIPTAISSLTLSNGSILLEHARLRPAQRLLRSPWLGPIFCRLVPKPYFKRVMRGLWGDSHRARPEDLDAMWRASRLRDGHLRTPRISRYLAERQRFRYRFLGALERFEAPVHLLWGKRDPVAVPAVARALAERLPKATLTWLDEVGHYPMLEAPDTWAAAALEFIEHYEQRDSR